MDQLFLRYYETELQFLRDLGGEFARAHERVAGRLALDAFSCADPYVERLLEGVAFLTARVRLKQDAEFERFTGRPPGAHTLGESVLQVAMHSQHHRGQVCRRLREVGATPPYVDYIIWLWAAGRRPVNSSA